MSDHMERGLFLYRTKRYADASTEFLENLKENPDDATCMAMLSMSMLAMGNVDDARRTAEKSVGIEPDNDFCYYAAAFVHFHQDNYSKARKMIAEAVRLSPENADYLDLSARIYLVQHKYKEALADAERGLEYEPDNVDCLNVRAMALIKLSRGKEALDSVDTALEEDPESSHSHANKGWILIEQNRAAEAMPYLKEALRLEPGDSWAREGVIEALKRRHFFYGIVAGLSLVAAKMSRHGWLYWTLWMIPPARAGLLLLFLAAWWGNQFFNLVICLDSVTRKVLTPDEIGRSIAFGGLTLILVLLIGSGLFTSFFTEDALIMSIVLVVLVTLPVCRLFEMGGRWRTFMIGYSAIGVLCALFFIFAGHDMPHTKKLPDYLAMPVGLAVLISLSGLFMPTKQNS